MLSDIYAESYVFHNLMPSVIMESVIKLGVVILIGIMLTRMSQLHVIS